MTHDIKTAPARKPRRGALGSQTLAERLYGVFNIVFFVLFALISIFPFYYLFINTVSSNTAVQKGLVNFYPIGLNLGNYIALKDVQDVGRAFLVTIARTLAGTAVMVLATGFVGYLMTKNEMWHRRLWYRFLIITMYFNAGLVPTYLNMVMLGLTNSFLVYIIPGIVAPYNIILVKTYIESIPAELEESARMDGAGYFRVFRSIIWPLSIPILATIAIFGAVGHWNSFTDSLIYMQSAPSLQTLQHRLYVYLSATSNLGALMQGGSNAGASAQAIEDAMNMKVIKYTVSMVSIIPILLVYPFMTRYFQKGLMLGAVKG